MGNYISFFTLELVWLNILVFKARGAMGTPIAIADCIFALSRFSVCDTSLVLCVREGRRDLVI